MLSNGRQKKKGGFKKKKRQGDDVTSTLIQPHQLNNGLFSSQGRTQRDAVAQKLILRELKKNSRTPPTKSCHMLYCMFFFFCFFLFFLSGDSFKHTQPSWPSPATPQTRPPPPTVTKTEEITDRELQLRLEKGVNDDYWGEATVKEEKKRKTLLLDVTSTGVTVDSWFLSRFPGLAYRTALPSVFWLLSDGRRKQQSLTLFICFYIYLHERRFVLFCVRFCFVFFLFITVLWS